MKCRDALSVGARLPTRYRSRTCRSVRLRPAGEVSFWRYVRFGAASPDERDARTVGH